MRDHLLSLESAGNPHFLFSYLLPWTPGIVWSGLTKINRKRLHALSVSARLPCTIKFIKIYQISYHENSVTNNKNEFYFISVLCIRTLCESFGDEPAFNLCTYYYYYSY